MNPRPIWFRASSDLPVALLLFLLGLSAAQAADMAPEPTTTAKENKWSAKAKLQVGDKNANVGTDTDKNVTAGSGRISGGAPAAGSQEMSGSVKLAGGSVGPVDVGLTAKAKVQTESLGKTGQNKDNIYDEKNFGAVNVSGSLAVGAKVGGNGVSVGGEIATPAAKARFTIDQSSSLLNRDRAVVLDKYDKEFNQDQLAADEQARQAKSAATKKAPAEKGKQKKTNEELMAEMERLDAEVKKVSSEMVKEKAPANPAPPAAAPSEPTVSGYLVMPRPSGLPDDDWQAMAGEMRSQLGAAGLNNQVQIDGRQMKMRMENVPESSLRQIEGMTSSLGFTFQRDR
jgi:hypothetical protein